MIKGLLKAETTPASGIETFETPEWKATPDDPTSGQIGSWDFSKSDTATYAVESGKLKFVDNTGSGGCGAICTFSSAGHVGDTFKVKFRMPTEGTHNPLVFYEGSTLVIHCGVNAATGHFYYYTVAEGVVDMPNCHYGTASECEVELQFYSTSQFKLRVDGGTWDTGNQRANWSSAVNAVISKYEYGGSTGEQSITYIDDVTPSWLYTPESTEDGEARGTFPVISGTAFNGYAVKFKATVPDDTSEPLEIRLSEDGKTAEADARVHLVFDPSDHLVYVMDSDGNPVSTGLSWTQDVEEEWAIVMVSTTELRVGKYDDYWAWSAVMEGRNTWTAGVKYFIAVTDDTSGVLLDDIRYAW